MKTTASLTMSVSIACALVGCAHTPKATAYYYLPKTEFSVKVLRTVACDGNKQPIMHVAVVGTSSYTADTQDRDGKPARKPVSFAALDGPFAKSATTVSFHPNGTLSGVNSETEGQGKEIFITALKVALLTPALLTAQQNLRNNSNLKFEDIKFEKECDFIAASSKDAVITLAYEGKVDLDAPFAQLQPIKPSHESSVAHGKLQNMVGLVCASVVEKAKREPPVNSGAGKELRLHLREPGLTTVSVEGGPSCSGSEYWSDQVLDGRNGTDYEVPIPKAALFGRNSFKIALAESGRITQLSYDKDAGAGSGLDAMAAMLEATRGQSIEEKAAALNAEADLILAQERLAKCEKDSTNCTK